MSRRGAGTLIGTACGLFAAGSVAVVPLVLGGPSRPEFAFFILFIIAVSVTPGGLVLAAFLSWWLERRTQEGASRGSTLALGLLAGLPLGLAATLSTPILVSGFRMLPELLRIDRPETVYTLLVGLAAGAGIGLGSAWVVSRPPKGGA